MVAAYAYAGAGARVVLPSRRVTPVAFGSPETHLVQLAAAPAAGVVRYRVALALTTWVDSLGRVGYTTHLYTCDAVMLCTNRLHTFAIDGPPLGVWLAPDFATSRTMYVAINVSQPSLIREGKVTTLFQSRDGGRSFAPLTGANRLIHDIYPTGCYHVGPVSVRLSFARADLPPPVRLGRRRHRRRSAVFLRRARTVAPRTTG